MLFEEENSSWHLRFLFSGSKQGLESRGFCPQSEIFKVLSEVSFREGAELAKRISALLSGHFSLGIENKRDGSLFLMRDAVGTWPLYYNFQASEGAPKFGFVLSEFESDCLLKPNYGFLGEYLAGHIKSKGETPQAKISKLESNSWLSLSKDRSKKGLVKSFLKPKDPVQLGEVKSAFEGALNRHDLNRPFLQLSGGLDSGAVFSLMLSLGVSPQGISIEFSDKDADERVWIDKWRHFLDEKYPVSKIHVHPHRSPKSTWATDWINKTADIASYPNGVFTAQVREILLRKSLGGEVSSSLFTGYGGDELFTEYQKPSFYRAVYGSVSDFRIVGVLAEVAKKLGMKNPWVPKFFTSKFLKDTNIEDRMQQVDDMPEGLSLRGKQIFRWLYSADAQLFRELEYRDSYIQNICLQSPFLDVDLVEACLWSQDEDFRGLSKPALREIAKESFPSPFLKRLGKADFSGVARSCLLQVIGRRNAGSTDKKDFLNGSPLVELGWVDVGRLRELHYRLSSSSWSTPKEKASLLGAIWQLWSVYVAGEYLKRFRG